MIAHTRLDELKRLWHEAVDGDVPASPVFRDAVPGLIEELARLRDENERLREGLGEVRRLLEVPPRGLATSSLPAVGLI